MILAPCIKQKDFIEGNHSCISWIKLISLGSIFQSIHAASVQVKSLET